MLRHLKKKSSGQEQKQPKKDAMCGATSKNTERVPPATSRTHLLDPYAMDAEHGPMEHVCLVGIQSQFGLFLSQHIYIWNGKFYSVPLYVGIIKQNNLLCFWTYTRQVMLQLLACYVFKEINYGLRRGVLVRS